VVDLRIYHRALTHLFFPLVGLALEGSGTHFWPTRTGVVGLMGEREGGRERGREGGGEETDGTAST